MMARREKMLLRNLKTTKAMVELHQLERMMRRVKRKLRRIMFLKRASLN